jgi:hypothetical protein
MKLCLGLLALTFVLSACSSVVPSPPIPTSTATPAARSSPPPATADPSPPAPRWRVDVVNGPRRVIVSIATDRAASLWFVDPGRYVTLLDWDEARPGGIELIEMTATGCVVLDTARFPAMNFTIRLDGARTGPYTMSLVPGVFETSLPTAEQTPSCSG